MIVAWAILCARGAKSLLRFKALEASTKAPAKYIRISYSLRMKAFWQTIYSLINVSGFLTTSFSWLGFLVDCLRLLRKKFYGKSVSGRLSCKRLKKASTRYRSLLGHVEIAGLQVLISLNTVTKHWLNVRQNFSTNISINMQVVVASAIAVNSFLLYQAMSDGHIKYSWKVKTSTRKIFTQRYSEH